MSTPLIDMIGKRFGICEVIERADDHITKSGIHVARYLIRCDCGTEKVVRGSCLRSGHTTSCGCLRHNKLNDLTGQTINGIFVESRVVSAKPGHTRWNAVCFCGNKFEVDGQHLLNGRIRSCGCISGKLKAAAKQTISPGMVFGDYMIESLNRRNNNGIYYWNCKCTVCGDNRVISKVLLREDNPPKCKKHVLKAVPDLIGQIFGYVHVDELSDKKSEDGSDLWNCTCTLCGGSTTKTLYQLRSKSSNSCGCLRKQKAGERSFIDLTDTVHGDIHVVEQHGKDKRGATLWKCECLRCGKIFDTITNNITRGKQNCGCSRTENVRKAKFKDLSNQTFNYILVNSFANYQDGRAVWNCTCLLCGKQFYTTAHELLAGDRMSCGCICSSGEQLIKSVLDKYNIKYIPQKTFIGCKSKAKLKFDFWLPDYGMCIEYDGEQHFGVVRNWHDNDDKYQRRKTHDQIKEQWCYSNDIVLLRIPYLDKKNIEDILLGWLYPAYDNKGDICTPLRSA